MNKIKQKILNLKKNEKIKITDIYGAEQSVTFWFIDNNNLVHSVLNGESFPHQIHLNLISDVKILNENGI